MRKGLPPKSMPITAITLQKTAAKKGVYQIGCEAYASYHDNMPGWGGLKMMSDWRLLMPFQIWQSLAISFLSLFAPIVLLFVFMEDMRWLGLGQQAMRDSGQQINPCTVGIKPHILTQTSIYSTGNHTHSPLSVYTMTG